jgi:integrase
VFTGFMAEINSLASESRAADPLLSVFVDEVYLPSDSVRSLSKDTAREYKRIWNRYLRDRVGGETLGSFRPATGVKLLESIVRDHELSKPSITHIKALLSGVFSFARTHGHFDGANPILGIGLPKARAGEETYAYSLEEEQRMIAVLDLMPRAAVAIASWAGLAKSEMMGLRWEDRINGNFRIRRSVCRGVVQDTKTEYRKADVPIIPVLAEILDEYWESLSRPAQGWIFPASRGSEKPIEFNNLYNRNIMKPLANAGVAWHGWHAFRRGLASNLSALGVPDNVIQQILRHGDVQTTQKFYRKTRRPAVDAAMEALNAELKTGQIRDNT